MTNIERANELGFTGNTDELFKLYESECRMEKIVLYRNFEQNLEYIMMTPNLVLKCDTYNPLGTNVLFMDQYHMILRHKRCIQNYLCENDNLVLFHLFFGVSTSDFFDSVSLNI